MTREEIEQSIENGKSVWYPKNRTIKQIDLKNTHPIFNGYQIDIMIEDENGWHTEFYGIEDLFKTQAEAEHYLHHANITRTETLPFLTWEEFKNKERIIFTTPTRFICALSYLDNILTLSVGKNNECTRRFVWDLTEANFYKAYDECVRLFKGE